MQQAGVEYMAEGECNKPVLDTVRVTGARRIGGRRSEDDSDGAARFCEGAIPGPGHEPPMPWAKGGRGGGKLASLRWATGRALAWARIQ